jgi:hypothetical protein
MAKNTNGTGRLVPANNLGRPFDVQSQPAGIQHTGPLVSNVHGKPAPLTQVGHGTTVDPAGTLPPIQWTGKPGQQIPAKK